MVRLLHGRHLFKLLFKQTVQVLFCFSSVGQSLGCPPNADPRNTMSQGQYCYEFVRTSKSWEDSKNDCEAKNGTLLTIENQSEQDFVYHMLEKFGYFSVVWLGLHDLAGEEDWRWVTGRSNIAI